MDPGTIATILTTAAGLVGGAWGGARYGKQQALSDAANRSSLSADVITTLQAKVDHLESQNAEKDHNLIELLARVEILEGLVTQRAEVSEVHNEVIGVRDIVDRIATRVGA